MPRTFDRTQPVTDKDPLRFGTDYLDPFGAIADGANEFGSQIRNGLTKVIKDLTGIDLTGAFEFVDWLGSEIGLALHNFGELWQDLLDGIVSVWTKAVDVVGSTVQNVIDAIGGILGVGENAALAADKANIGVQSLKASQAGGGFDEFNYDSANELPAATYAITYSGPGAGHYGPNGSGFVVWKPSGSSVREVVYRRTDVTLGSDNGVVTVVWSTRPRDPFFNDSYGYIDGRVADNGDNTRVRARIDNNTAVIQAIVNGTVTQIGGTKTLTIRNGDVFELWYGTGAKPRQFWLKQNGVTVHTVEDTGAVSSLGTGFRQVGFGCRVDTFGVLIAQTQNPAPSLAGWTWATQTTP